MASSQFLVKLIFTLAALGAAPLAALWIAFTYREIRSAHHLARLRRLHASHVAHASRIV